MDEEGVVMPRNLIDYLVNERALELAGCPPRLQCKILPNWEYTCPLSYFAQYASYGGNGEILS
jgi:hypothetical protein